MTDKPVDPEGVSLIDVVKEMYNAIDEIAERARKVAPVTCVKGCSHCCKLLTSITFPEGMLIANHLYESGEWKDWLPKLREAALANSYDGMNKGNFFDKALPCVFLKDDLCIIYEKRPVCCRTHMVMSPPEWCEPVPANRDKKTAAINMLEVEGAAWRFAKEVEQQLGLQSQLGFMNAPIPIMVLYCLYVASEDNPAERYEVARAIKNVPTPDEWMMKHMRAMFEEGQGIEGEAADQLYHIGKGLFGR